MRNPHSPIPPQRVTPIPQIYSEIPADLLEIVEDAVLCRRADATERLLARAEEEKVRRGNAGRGRRRSPHGGMDSAVSLRPICRG